MITSMTGFGNARQENEVLRLDVQVKSVNGRFLEMRFRLPREYLPYENEIKKRLSQKLHRGTVDLSINRTLKETGQDIEIAVNYGLAEGWLKATKRLADKFKLDSKISLETLARLPDVISLSQTNEISEIEKGLLFETIDEALENCVREREREGEGQLKIFSKLLENLDAFVRDITNKKDSLDKKLQTKLKDRLTEIQKDLTIDPNRLAQEVLFILDRADIAEEIARTQTHLKAFRDTLKHPSPVGKKLEFYTQELHREVNTMGSKTQSLDVTLDIIEAKTTVERIREQVQNVE